MSIETEAAEEYAANMVMFIGDNVFTTHVEGPMKQMVIQSFLAGIQWERSKMVQERVKLINAWMRLTGKTPDEGYLEFLEGGEDGQS